jgi:hypothetical protein
MTGSRFLTYTCATALVVLAEAHASEIHFAGEQLLKPADYREWIYLGTALTPHDLNDNKASFPEFHTVYMNPSAWRAWKKTGTFAQGTVIAKELSSVGEHHAISGKGYFQGEFSVLAVAVKDNKRFAQEPGGWGYFVFDKAATTKTTATRQPTQACASCHQAHAAQDLVFTQYYPVLRAGAGSQ